MGEGDVVAEVWEVAAAVQAAGVERAHPEPAVAIEHHWVGPQCACLCAH